MLKTGDGMTNHWLLDCFSSSLLEFTTKKTSKIKITGPFFVRNPPVTSGFPTQSARYAVIVFITWCQHRLIYILIVLFQYAPFVFKDHEKTNVTMGYCVDMLELLSQMLDFRYGLHDDVIKWKHFPRHWPFVWGIHRSLVNSP